MRAPVSADTLWSRLDVDKYGRELERGLRLAGEGRDHFARARVERLARFLPAGFRPGRILDYGCGDGATTALLGRAFPGASVVGADVADAPLRYARQRCTTANVAFCRIGDLAAGRFDLCYMNGVLHHVPRGDRLGVLRFVAGRLSPGGWLAVWENNALSPAAHVVMRMVRFDRGLLPLADRDVRRLLVRCGLAVARRTEFVFFFPAWLRALRVHEDRLHHVPLGAQYVVLARRPGSGSNQPTP